MVTVKPVVAKLARPALFNQIIEHDKTWFDMMARKVVPMLETTRLLWRKRELIKQADRLYYPSKEAP